MSFGDTDFTDPIIDPKKRARSYCGTKNNYTSADIDKLESWAQSDKVKYLVYGLEVSGPPNDTPHIQFYMELSEGISMTCLVNKVLFPCWLGKRRGKPEQAAGYCMKGEAYAKDYTHFYKNPSITWRGKQFGTLSCQGNRTDLDVVARRMVDENATIKEIAQEHPTQFVKFHKGFTSLRYHLMEPRNLSHMPEVIVRCGPTATGKSYNARHTDFPGVPHYVWGPAVGKWLDGYDGQDKIIIEEFRSHIPFGELLEVLDRYECTREVKGGTVHLQASKFVICSPTHPTRWYPNLDDRQGKFNQLLRRITTIIDTTPTPEIPECLRSGALKYI